MDELEISGKRYISTRRAAKEHKYHSDYIGQLIRAGKVEGQKVGRSWYVVADSLDDYLGKEASPAVKEFVREEVAEPEAPQVDVVNTEDEKENRIPLKIYKPETKKESLMIQTSRSSLRYLADDAPLYPRIERPRAQVMPRFVEEVVEEPVYREEEQVIIIERPRGKKNTVSFLMKGGVIITAGVIVLGIVAVASMFVVSTTTVEGEVASTAYSLVGI